MKIFDVNEKLRKLLADEDFEELERVFLTSRIVSRPAGTGSMLSASRMYLNMCAKIKAAEPGFDLTKINEHACKLFVEEWDFTTLEAIRRDKKLFGELSSDGRAVLREYNAIVKAAGEWYRTRGEKNRKELFPGVIAWGTDYELAFTRAGKRYQIFYFPKD